MLNTVIQRFQKIIGFVETHLQKIRDFWKRRSPMEPHGALRSPTEPYGALRSPTEPYGARRSPTDPDGALRNPAANVREYC